MNRVQRQNLSNQNKQRPHRRKSRNLSDWASDEIQEELWLGAVALDNKRQFQLQSGGRTGAGKHGLRTLVHLQRPKRFRIVSKRSTQELVPKNDCSRGGCIPFPAKRGPWSRLQPVFASLRNKFPRRLPLNYLDTDITLWMACLHHEIQHQQGQIT